MTYAIILAGGAGTRFWPLSSYAEPKQFLNLYSDRPMLEQTIRRIRPLIEKNNIYIATNKIYHRNIKDCLKKLDIHPQNILLEPEGKNTFAPIGLLSKNIYNKDKASIVLVLPCDHYIKNENKFLNVLNKAIKVAKKGYIVTLGITPDKPETGYGYIKVNAKRKTQDREEFCAVEKFIEKPNLQMAKKFIRDKRYYWNAGIFIFGPDIMLEEIKKFAPRDSRLIAKINDKKSLNKLWPQLVPISIDYAVMEKTNKITLIPADFGWMDLGNWRSIECFAKKDKCGNIFRGNCVDIGSKNILAWSDKRLLTTLGLNSIIIVDTKDALLVCAKDKTQDIRKLVQILKQKKLYK